MRNGPRNYLFVAESLAEMLRQRHAGVAETVDRVPQEQFLLSSDGELVAHLLPALRIEPIELDEAGRSMTQSETKVDVSRDGNRVFSSGGGGPFFIPGTRLEISIPFTGEPWLFQYKTNPSLSVFPRGDVEAAGGKPRLRISVERAHDVAPENIKVDVDRDLDLLRRTLSYSKSQVEAFNQHLEQNLRNSISQRRKRLEKHAALASMLDIPLAAKEGAPPLKRVIVETKPAPRLPVVPKTGLQQEPGISDESYEKILSVIRLEGRSFETTPTTFSKFSEEELRDLLVAHLNGHFQGKAAGEVFRKSGKSDICIQEDSRAAFVGECKIWGGASQVQTDLNQLLGYLTWRDCKAALIVFNKTVKEFSVVQQGLAEAVRSHPNFHKEVPSTEPGEWRVVMRSTEDAGRLVTIQVFAFNVVAIAKK